MAGYSVICQVGSVQLVGGLGKELVPLFEVCTLFLILNSYFHLVNLQFETIRIEVLYDAGLID